MTTTRLLTNTCTLLAVAMLLACGSGVTRITGDDHSAAGDNTDEPAAQSNIEVFEAGDADMTVVFEAGLGNDWTAWEPVAKEVAAEARVFAYSRPGYGKSEATEEPRDAARIVEDLRALLSSHGYAPPFVLVGHSFGGTYMELFAKAHPDEVAGVVLVDPRHRDFTAACEEAQLEGCKIPESILASLPAVQIAEYEAFAQSSDEIRAAGSFGSYPVRVLTATSHSFSPEAEKLWESMLGSLADEAEDGEQQLFPGAGHGLQSERPHQVAAAILDVVSAAR
jgi:pimeloyl-ACP methyl ester carboxylesterase